MMVPFQLYSINLNLITPFKVYCPSFHSNSPFALKKLLASIKILNALISSLNHLFLKTIFLGFFSYVP